MTIGVGTKFNVDNSQSNTKRSALIYQIQRGAKERTKFSVDKSVVFCMTGLSLFCIGAMEDMAAEVEIRCPTGVTSSSCSVVTSSLRPLKRTVKRFGELVGFEILAHQGEDVSYLHAGLCMAALPHRKPADDLEPWIRTNGRFKLAVWPGRILNKDGSHGQIGVPYGTRARLI